jgi:hypothetical protein
MSCHLDVIEVEDDVERGIESPDETVLAQVGGAGVFGPLRRGDVGGATAAVTTEIDYTVRLHRAGRTRDPG